MSESLVGIVANPASGKDIRRLVAHGSSFDNNEKINIVRRVLLGMDAVGTERVAYMPDTYAIVERAASSITLRPRLEPLSMPMVGIHAGNRDLYREQNEFLASVVRALTSAIDAKDPYTCGHSDRVARVAVRLAKELGHDPATLHTLYMAGLLHDIGKIGIDDAVLRKPGKLTNEEFEQIKQHPELGYRILADIRQFASVLPAVLHHHEQWDGRGYPFKLAGDQTPKLARIVAVADAFDAMSSDRPYRKGMEAAKVDEILKAGAGKQWDPEVVAAFFAARADITAMSAEERANLTLDVQQWV